MACSVVCVSHTTGSGGDEVGKEVAQRLGYLYIDEEIVARAAAAGGFEPEDIADEERRKSYARRLLETLAEGDPAWTTSASVDLVRPGDIRSLIRETVVQTAARGNVVIVAHAASHALEPGPEILRVFVTASPRTREERVALADGIEQAQAARAIKDSDAGRSDYLKRFYSVDRESPEDYDIVVSTDRLSTEDAAEIVLNAAAR